ncbi:MAG TPA: hypothetical protein VIK14_00085 [Ignavibacteria bacterium]
MNTKTNDNLFNLLKELSKANIKYVVCGGVACVLQGVERATFDLDIAFSFTKEDLDKLLKITEKFKLIPRIPEPVKNLYDEEKREKWVREKGALVYTFFSSSGPLQIDIFLSYPISFQELFVNADIIKVEGLEVYVSSKEDLLKAKKKIIPLRDKDKIDIKELKKLIGEKKKTD